MLLKGIEARSLTEDVTGLFTCRSPSVKTVGKPQLRQVEPESSRQAATLVFADGNAREKQMHELVNTFATEDRVLVRLDGHDLPITAFRPINERELIIIVEEP